MKTHTEHSRLQVTRVTIPRTMTVTITVTHILGTVPRVFHTYLVCQTLLSKWHCPYLKKKKGFLGFNEGFKLLHNCNTGSSKLFHAKYFMVDYSSL